MATTATAMEKWVPLKMKWAKRCVDCGAYLDEGHMAYGIKIFDAARMKENWVFKCPTCHEVVGSPAAIMHPGSRSEDDVDYSSLASILGVVDDESMSEADRIPMPPKPDGSSAAPKPAAGGIAGLKAKAKWGIQA